MCSVACGGTSGQCMFVHMYMISLHKFDVRIYVQCVPGPVDFKESEAF